MTSIGDNITLGGLDSHLDVDLAIKRVHRNIIRRGAFPNRLDAELLRQFPKEIRDRVNELLQDQAMDWANGSARFFDLPRRDNLVRPICYLDIDIAVVYQALVDAVGKVVEPYLLAEFDDRVLGHRLKSDLSETMFRDHSEAFSTFIAIQHHYATGPSFSHCVKLDIANYYERIYHHKLQQLLEVQGVSGSVTSAVSTLLRKFANGDSHGIPQGLWASDYLGNIYLLYLDEFLKARGIYAIRYVDDYRIFCNSEREGLQILKECCTVLRGIGLNPQPLKTSVVTVDKLNPDLKPLTERFLDLRTRKVQVVIRYLALASMGEEIIAEEIQEREEEQQQASPLTDDDIRDFERLWTEAVDQEDSRSSILSFALSGLTAGESSTAEQYVLDKLAEFPNLASASSKYLVALGFKEETSERILSFIESEDCIHESQQMWLLQYFRSSDAVLDTYKSRLKVLLSDSNRHPIVRSVIAEILALKGTISDGEFIKQLFTSESDRRVRRSLLLGYRLLSHMERNYAISYLPPGEWNLKLVGSMVKSGEQVN